MSGRDAHRAPPLHAETGVLWAIERFIQRPKAAWTTVQSDALRFVCLEQDYLGQGAPFSLPQGHPRWFAPSGICYTQLECSSPTEMRSGSVSFGGVAISKSLARPPNSKRSRYPSP